jgi:uncharacterized SAM-binding protein YcdF (DUF218 family)
MWMESVEPGTQPGPEAPAQPATTIRTRRVRRPTKLLVLLAVAGLLVAFALSAGRLLVTDRPATSDAIVVLAGDSFDDRYNLGMKLLRAGYAKHMFLDVASDHHYFGRLPTEIAAEFIQRDAGDMRGFVSVCPYAEDSTVSETKYVARCLEPLHPRKVLLVTSDWHTARALSIFNKRLPQYQWSVAAARDPDMFGVNWWQRREWAKTALFEWLKVVWWNVVDRWR